MTRYRDQDDDDEDEWEDTVYIDVAPDDEPTVPCPYCKSGMPVDSPTCFCTGYLTAQMQAEWRKTIVVTALVAAALLCLVVALAMYFLGF